MWFSVYELSFISRPIFQSKIAFPMTFPFEPIALVKICSFFNPVTLYLIINPSSLEYPSIKIIENSLSIFITISHLSLIPLCIFVDKYPFARINICLPLTKIDISTVVLKNASSMFEIIFELTLVGLIRRVLHLLNIFKELAISTKNITFEERLDDASLLLLQMLHVV